MVKVKLELMSTAEAVGMLATRSGLDAQAAPAALVEVSRLCGSKTFLFHVRFSVI